MSRRSIKEYILRQQEDYLGEFDRRRRSRMLDEVCRMTGLGRKYVIRLLRGTRTCRERPGLGKPTARGGDAARAGVGGVGGPVREVPQVRHRPLAPGPRPAAERPPRRGGQRGGHERLDDGAHSQGAPAHGQGLGPEEPPLGAQRPHGPRPLRKRRGRACLGKRARRRSGRQRRLLRGDRRGGLLLEATATDRWSGWFEARPSFNLCAANYKPAFQGNLEAMPFPIRRVHSDSGPELVNSVIHEYLTGHWPRTRFSRSWPGRKNYNANIEQKNGSVLRAFIGDTRLGQPGLRRAFELLLEDICEYHN